jgi:hypothetical protein
MENEELIVKKQKNPFNSLVDFISCLEKKVTPKEIIRLSMTFNGANHFNFNSGEFSIVCDSDASLQKFIQEILSVIGFNGYEMFSKLTNYTNCYVEINPLNMNYINPIHLFK